MPDEPNAEPIEAADEQVGLTVVGVERWEFLEPQPRANLVDVEEVH
jgi:hypothetical protein